MAGQVLRGIGCEEDFVKSFVPTLFDSDSEQEESFAQPSPNDEAVVSSLQSLSKPLQVHLGKPMKKTTSSEAFSKTQSYNKQPLTNLDLVIKEEQPEASSPSSRGNSNSSTQTPFSGSLDCSDSMDSATPFYSMLSFESADTAFDFDSACLAEELPAKRQKVDSAMLRQSPMSVSMPLSASPVSYALKTESSPACNLPSAHSVPTPSRIPLALMPRHSVPVHSPLPFNVGSITTGIPVDSCTSELGRPWLAPQTMIPTHPPNSFYSGPHANHIPANLPAPVTSHEKIAAALLEVKKAPLTASPLGLRLDKSKLASGLLALGMVLKD